MPTNDGSESSAGASKTSGCRHVSSGAEFSAAMRNLNPTTAAELGGGSGSTRTNGGTEHERRRHAGGALSAYSAIAITSPQWTPLRLVIATALSSVISAN